MSGARRLACSRVGAALALGAAASGCAADEARGASADAGATRTFVAVTFNTGTNDGLPHDGPPDDGYGSAEAAIADASYGNGLAWKAAIEDARRFFEELTPDIVAFQEIFHPGDCAAIPEEARAGFVCEGWKEGDPTVAQTVVGAGYQVACHVGNPDKCVAVRRAFGTLRGCDGDLCLEGLAGAKVEGCGGGSRVGRGVIDLADGGTPITVVNVHGTSGILPEDQACRAAQFAQVFVDLGLGDGEPAASGERNVILGDLNTDPGRLEAIDESARAWNAHLEGSPFRHVTPFGPEAPPTYAGLFNIDHVVSDAFGGSCPAPKPVTEMVYFDHLPIVCQLQGPK